MVSRAPSGPQNTGPVSLPAVFGAEAGFGTEPEALERFLRFRSSNSDRRVCVISEKMPCSIALTRLVRAFSTSARSAHAVPAYGPQAIKATQSPRGPAIRACQPHSGGLHGAEPTLSLSIQNPPPSGGGLAVIILILRQKYKYTRLSHRLYKKGCRAPAHNRR